VSLTSAGAPPLEQAVRAWHSAGHSQGAIARELNIDRRKIKRIIDQAA
jgi:DNA-binding transcriptional regulator LsrR (DeoR family)